ncbi:hypothetical protein [Phytohabitans suffuscus]|uniref:Uncharacterized protein n=1 Tax=Phytohabitans suffuscus TaxID=624315 RepID=A0A6F8YYB6_9ACTN|nr:hypothetical protein [Phytohabitans suffuscus]BCB90831.1 hypothetical protein Psuf_081440 [Phytohabitans suffuscus]
MLEARTSAYGAGMDLTLVNVHGLAPRVLAIREVLPVLTRAG